MTLLTLDHSAAAAIARPAFRAGNEAPDFGEHLTDLCFGAGVDLEALRSVVDEAMRRHHGGAAGTESDVWLAPRLHHVLRLSRRQAAAPGLWMWLAAVEFPDYVRWRWGGEPGDESAAAKTERFAGPPYKHALARLWWTAELCRNGDDYSPVAIALGKQDIQNNLLRMDIAHHRPTVQAALRVLAGRGADAANALAKATNSAATTLIIDVIGPDEPLLADAIEQWLDEASSVDPTRWFDETPPGPDDGVVPAASVAALEPFIEAFLDEAPYRDRSRGRT